MKRSNFIYYNNDNNNEVINHNHHNPKNLTFRLIKINLHALKPHYLHSVKQENYVFSKTWTTRGGYRICTPRLCVEG